MDLYQVPSSGEGESKSDSNLSRVFQKEDDHDSAVLPSSEEDESKPRFNFQKIQRSLDFIQTKSIEEDDPGDSTAFSTPVEGGIFAELISTTNSSNFRGMHFFSALLEKDSMWISGSDELQYDCFLHVKVPNFQVLLQKTKYQPKPHLHTIMASFAKWILFAKKGGRDIYGFNIQSKIFETILSDVDFQIDAMCCNDDSVYIFQKKHPDVIKILDSNFQSAGHIPTGFKGNISDCKVDICTITASTQKWSSLEYKMKHQHMCIISISNPSEAKYRSSYYQSVRAVNEGGLIWQVDSQRCPELGSMFNPCSVSTSEEGDVFIADNGADRVRVFYYMPLLEKFLSNFDP